MVSLCEHGSEVLCSVKSEEFIYCPHFSRTTLHGVGQFVTFTVVITKRVEQFVTFTVVITKTALPPAYLILSTLLSSFRWLAG